LPELQYYFPRAGLPVSSLVRPADQASKVYVVVPSDVAAPPNGRVVAEFTTSKLYEVRKP
jgi:hypothetical protein